ncbi:MAG: hypothetical protein KA488_04670 [Flavobacterium sp.]|nr:hypothetical protein [Flavobacterium sp.]
MFNKYVKFFFLAISTILFISCSDNDDEYTVLSPVTVNLSTVPYPKLSDYHFFVGDMKNQVPESDVLPYEPASSLFTDYAHKKRFVWIPKGMKATYDGDGKVLQLPVGSAIIKTFYYEKVQPLNTTKIIETRLMIRKADGWIFAEYVWNNDQTEAYLDMNGSNVSIDYKDENNILQSVPNYRIPNVVQCIICHKSKQMVNNVEVDTYIPIGIKPQNLNFEYNYGNETKNQLTKWIEKGILQNNFSLPSEANTAIDYKDASKPLEKRVRSYLDINCAHCHQDNRHCDYRPMRFSFTESGDIQNGRANLGICVDTQDMQDFPPALSKIISPGNVNRSMLYYRLNTTNENFRMPLHGRTVIHTEGVNLLQQWINTLQPCQ